jgi:hypothetical protein
MRKHHARNRIDQRQLAYLKEPTASFLDRADATALTQRIRTTADGLCDLLLEAHDGKAWKALGYKTWNDYVKAEFDMSRRNSYRLLKQARVGHELETFVPHAAQITQRDAEAVSDDLPGFKSAVSARVDAGEDPKKAADETIAAKRAEKESAKAEPKAEKEKARAEKAARQAEIDRQRQEHRDKLPEAVKANADLYGEMKVQWECGGYEKVVADQDEVIRVVESQVYSESADKVSWMRSALWWKEQAIKLGWPMKSLEIEDGTAQIDATIIAEAFGVAPERLIDLMRQGKIWDPSGRS